MTFQREIITQPVIEEFIPTLQKHYEVTTDYPEIKLNPDYGHYLQAEKDGVIRLFTARDLDWNLAAYYICIVRPHAHHRQSLTAFHDMLWVNPEHRGLGKDFVEFCDNELKKEGVQLSYQTLKPGHGFEKKLFELGYKKHEVVYSRRLN